MRQQPAESTSAHLCNLARGSVAIVVPVNAGDLALAVHIAGNTLQAPDPWSGIWKCTCTIKRQVSGATSGVMSPCLSHSGLQLQVCRHGGSQDAWRIHWGQALRLCIQCSARNLRRTYILL